MGVRNCREVGENLQLIVKRLMANDDLVKLLYYTDVDPLHQPNLSPQDKNTKIFNKLIKIIPIVTDQDNSNSHVILNVINGREIDNKEFLNVIIRVQIFVPLNQWIINDVNLRPFWILGCIQESLDGKTVNGLGKLKVGGFDLQLLTDEVGSYAMDLNITAYD